MARQLLLKGKLLWNLFIAYNNKSNCSPAYKELMRTAFILKSSLHNILAEELTTLHTFYPLFRYLEGIAAGYKRDCYTPCVIFSSAGLTSWQVSTSTSEKSLLYVAAF
jgi:hypothetical protein